MSCQYSNNESLSPDASITSSDDKNHIKVYLRVKPEVPMDKHYEIKDNTFFSKVPDNLISQRSTKEVDTTIKKFQFTEIFHQSTTQIKIFNSIVKPKVKDFINGLNSTVLAYGASGSGKTYTISGTADEPGIIPRTLEFFFQSLPQLPVIPEIKPLNDGSTLILDEKQKEAEMKIRLEIISTTIGSIHQTDHVKTYRNMEKVLKEESLTDVKLEEYNTLGVWISFAEIYNEHIYDLLEPLPEKGKSRVKLSLGHDHDTIFIKNLKTVSVSSGLDAYQLLQYGIQHLNYAATTINSHSSRSHSVFTIKLVKEGIRGFQVSYFNFCDLAGAERSKKTGHKGTRLQESGSINRSLLVLGKCLNSIRDKQKKNTKKVIPFRECKLTQLFQRALNGQENIMMIVNINPSREMFDESNHVLNFSAIAKDIIIEEKQNRFTRFSNFMKSCSTSCSFVELNTYKISNLQEQLAQKQAEQEEAANEHTLIVDHHQELARIKENQLNQMWRKQFKKLKKYYRKALRRKDSSLDGMDVTKVNNELQLIKHQLDACKENNDELLKILQDSHEGFIKLELIKRNLQRKNEDLLAEKMDLLDKLHLLEEENFCSSSEEKQLRQFNCAEVQQRNEGATSDDNSTNF